MGEAERGESAPRVQIAYFCVNDHVVRPSFATADESEIPDEWDCPRCGFPAGRNPYRPPEPAKAEPYKTHLAYVKERRTPEEGEAILDEALTALRTRRGEA